MKSLEHIHGTFVHSRRTRVLAETAAGMLPRGLRVVDIGCGDGLFATMLSELRPDLEVTGVEVAPRATCRIPVIAFDGEHLPFADNHFGASVLIDVLHHTPTPSLLLKEAARVSGGCVLIKDHNMSGPTARFILRFMDETANRRHHIALPFNYLGPAEWSRAYADCGVEVERSDPLRRLYPFPANLVFGRRLHFMALLRRLPS